MVEVSIVIEGSTSYENVSRTSNTTRKHKFYEGSFPRYFVVKAVLRRISEETRFVVIRLS
ncbi:hypothetical protein YC2023_088703 [Brassica napus]